MERGEKILYSVALFLALLVLALGVSVAPAHAYTVAWETTSDNDVTYFGSSDYTRVNGLAETVVMPTSTWLCEVAVKIYRIRAGVAGAVAKLSVYHNNATLTTDQDSGDLLVQSGILETSIPLDPGSGYSTYQYFTIAPFCVYLVKGERYSFVLTREPTYSGGNGLMARRRTTDQYTYSNEYAFVTGAWNTDYPKELIIRLNAVYGAAPEMVQDMGVFGKMFYPSSDSLDQFQSQITTLSGKAPWGYTNTIGDLVFDLTTTTPTDLVFSFAPPFPGMATATLNITDQVEAVPDNVKAWSAYGFMALVWLSFLGYIWWRGLHFQETPPSGL